jgi:L-asparaginase II
LIHPKTPDPATAGYVPVLELTRGGLTESVHYGAIAAADADGDLVAAWGDPATVTFLRSSAKPLQALATVECGAADRFGFGSEQIALMCASHSGTDAHAQVAAGMLAALGLSEADLLCGTHPPLDAATARRLEADGERAGPLRNNCSGKHAGMLALSAFLGEAHADYLSPDGPVQQRILRAFAEMCGLEPERVGVGIDGCSAPNFAVPLRAAATAVARLMQPDRLSQPRQTACSRIVSSMTAHPELVGGPGRFDTRLMQACRGRVLSKGGAEGYLALGLPAGALGPRSPACGLAFKIADGDRAGRAVAAAALEALTQLGVLGPAELEALSDLAPPRPLENHRGLVVGDMRACFHLR